MPLYSKRLGRGLDKNIRKKGESKEHTHTHLAKKKKTTTIRIEILFGVLGYC